MRFGKLYVYWTRCTNWGWYNYEARYILDLGHLTIEWTK